MNERNWAGNHEYAADAVRRPASLDELAVEVSESSSVRALGSRHSFSHVVDADLLVDLSDLPGEAVVSADRSTVTVPGHWTYARLADALAAEGLALHNLASLPHISIAGAIATGTHGSGDTNGNLATAVTGVETMTATGDVLSIDRSDPRFGGAVVSMGLLGIVTGLTLRVEPTFDVAQHVFEAVDVGVVVDSFDEIFGSAYSVSAFTRWAGDIEQIWLKQRGHGAVPLGSVFDGLRPAAARRHPIIELDASGCTEQRGAVGPWHERLPHFRTGFVPSAGDEIQSEFFVPRTSAASAIEAMQRIGSDLADVLLVSEVRTVAADNLWMSPHCGRDSVAFHFTWRRDKHAVAAAVTRVEHALSPFGVRPHWGKVFSYEAFAAAAEYRRLGDFLDLQRSLDPTGKFVNPWATQVLGASRGR